MANEGSLATSAATFAVYANEYRSGGPWQYTVPAHSSSGDGVVTDYFNIGSGYGSGAYDLTMTGPNRFLRRFPGNATTSGQYAEVTSHYAPSPNLNEQSLWLTMTNSGTSAVTFTVTSNHYRTDGPWTYSVARGRERVGLLEPGRVLRRLVRLHDHGQRRLVLVPALHRTHRDRCGQRHRLIEYTGTRRVRL